MNNVLGLKLAQIGAKGMQVLDRQVKKTDSKKRIIFNRICAVALIVLSLWNLYNISGTVNVTKKHLDSIFPPTVTHTILLAVSYISAVRLLLSEYLSTILFFTVDFKSLGSNITNDINDFLKSTVTTDYINETDFVINSAAVLLSLKLVLDNGVKRLSSILIMLLWNVNMLWPKIAEQIMSNLPGDIFRVSLIAEPFHCRLKRTFFCKRNFSTLPLKRTFYLLFVSSQNLQWHCKEKCSCLELH